MSEPMLTAQQAGERLGIDAERVLSLAASGMLASYRFGTQVRFDEADLLECDRRLMQARSPRVLRERARLRLPLTPEEQAIAFKRHRRMRMAPWANGKAIRAVYAKAKRLSRETGTPHHVDHIIPLQGEFVSGLHVEDNLQILPGTDNIRKKNRFEVGE